MMIPNGKKGNNMRIIQLSLLLVSLVLFIFIAIMDESHIVTMFYASVCLIGAIGLWLMRANEEFIDHMNEQIRNNRKE
jgi:uncharacterized membrane protein YqjE